MIDYSVFVVDDEESVREGVRNAFGGTYRLRGFPDGESAVGALAEERPDLILLDIGLPGMSGIEALQAIKGISPEILVIVITAYEDIATVIAAMRRGAHDYVVKPLQMETLGVSIRNALETVRLKKEVQSLQERFLRENLPCFVGASDAIQDVMEFVETIAKSPDTPVLVLGETGTGKELIAGAIHYRSPNFRGPLVSVNCAAIPRELIESELFGYEKGAFSGASLSGKKGLVEQAAGGTLFLDEVGDLSLEAQAKLLRFLEEGRFYRVGGTRPLQVSTRVVSATNKDPENLIRDGLFREDLYYRLAVIRVKVPSLDERREDILPIARFFLVEFGRKFGKAFTGIAPEAEEALRTRRWKGNVRELRNLIERGALTGKGPQVVLDDLGLTDSKGNGAPRVDSPQDSAHPWCPPFRAGGIDLPSVQQTVERHYIAQALRETDGNETRAAQLLKLNHHTFRYRRKKLGL